ncbi:hypothetical protein HPB50_020549 [Hyalomma asiaticum]|uniref:Uncharacterized protein n=1 Tax=Hyalomma asiaticum TaxID=266040 RepID=A0ACB7TJC8_HYAAI|nr:hypothetical protein HPB50_020549 [Hyalomma asiaticum]
MYNELFLYNIKKNNWLLVKCPNLPPPRCAHQDGATVLLHPALKTVFINGPSFTDNAFVRDSVPVFKTLKLPIAWIEVMVSKNNPQTSGLR